MFFNLFGKKRKHQDVDVNEEVKRILHYMVECKGSPSSIITEKIFISEAAYHAIWSEVCEVLKEKSIKSFEQKGQNPNSPQWLKYYNLKTTIADKIIDRLYEIDWVY